MACFKRLKRFLKSYYYISVPYNSGKGFHKSELELQEKYYSYNGEKSNGSETQLILMVDGRFIHGGLSDRLRGIISIYHYCKDNGLKFNLHYIYPFDLSHFLEPNEYDWMIDPEKITYNLSHAIPVVINDWQFDTCLHKKYLDRVVTENTGKQIHVYSNSPYYNNFFSNDFQELFCTSEKLQSRIDEIVKSIGLPYVAMVFRFQQLLGDFKEVGYETLEKSEQESLIRKCINKIRDVHDAYHQNKLILVTSDSTTFLQAASSALDFVRIIPGKVVHMDHTSDASDDIYMKSFVDMLVLSKAEKIYLLQTGAMYHSSFAKQAAMIGNVEYEEVVF